MKKILKNNILINENIPNKYIRIVGDINPTSEIPKSEALIISTKYNKDLILISTYNNIGICKIYEFQKFIYEKKQKERENKKNQKKTKLKEIRFTYNTGDHDFKFKLKHAINFLERGDKVKTTVWFTGREVQFADQGELLLLRFVDELKDL